MWTYSSDLRERIVKACQSGMSQVEAARTFSVSLKTVQRYLQRAALGEMEARRPRGQTPRLLPDQEEAFMAMVEEHPDHTLAQFCEEWERRSGVLLRRSTLHKHLQRLGGRFKKNPALLKNDAK